MSYLRRNDFVKACGGPWQAMTAILRWLVTPAARIVALALLRMDGPKMHRRPGRKVIAPVVRMQPSAVGECLKALRAKGYLKIDRTADHTGRKVWLWRHDSPASFGGISTDGETPELTADREKSKRQNYRGETPELEPRNARITGTEVQEVHEVQEEFPQTPNVAPPEVQQLQRAWKETTGGILPKEDAGKLLAEFSLGQLASAIRPEHDAFKAEEQQFRNGKRYVAPRLDASRLRAAVIAGKGQRATGTMPTTPATQRPTASLSQPAQPGEKEIKALADRLESLAPGNPRFVYRTEAASVWKGERTEEEAVARLAACCSQTKASGPSVTFPSGERIE